MTPDPRRVAVHQAGHAVAQALIGRDRFNVLRLAIGAEDNPAWPGRVARGSAVIDRPTQLNVYEFGLVTLAGIAAEERYLASRPPEAEPLVALSDLAEWQQQAGSVLGEAGKVDLVTRNVMRRLQLWFAEPEIWQVVENLVDELLVRGELADARLQRLLSRLPDARSASRAGNQTAHGGPQE